MRTCKYCNQEKPIVEFKHKNGTQCKSCYRKKRREADQKRNRKKGVKPMYENKLCPSYFGIVIAEGLVKHLFNDVEIMPYGNPKFDFICNRGKKINVKSACISLNKGKYPCWGFDINYNTTADFFICVAFDNRTDLNPLHLWIIPGNEVNHQTGITIRPSSIHKWDKWKGNIEDAQLCCAKIKKEK